jgi:hypothetical protein
MPKKKKRKELKAKAGQDVNEAMAVNQAMEAAAEVAIQEAAKSAHYKAVVAKGVEKVDALYKAAKDKNSRVHVGSVDMGGALLGSVSFQAVNWLFRKLSEYNTHLAENIDYYQSIPQLVVGLASYWGELLSRKPDSAGSKVFPSMPREVFSEWSKVFTILGANNLFRALTVRRKDTKKALADAAAVKAERDAIKAERDAIKAKLESMGTKQT